ncbi:hypothetical protein B9G54_06410 [Alloscardovia macacae]|nr:hypothetical protein B9G54_06410 [Alloscardovia macacae]
MFFQTRIKRKYMNLRAYRNPAKIMLAAFAAVVLAVVMIIPGILPGNAATAKAVTNEISGTLSATPGSSSVTNQALTVKTTTTEAASAGDYVEYTFTNVASTTLDNQDIKLADGTIIGKLRVISAAVAQVNKQSSGNASLQQDTTLDSWTATVRAVFNSEIERYPNGTTFEFSSKGISMPVVWANKNYELHSTVTTTNGTGSIENTLTIPLYPPSTGGPSVGVIGTITFDSNQNMTTDSTLVFVPQKELNAGDEVTLNLSDASGIEFIPGKVKTAAITKTATRQVTTQTPVNGNGAYIIESPSATLQVTNVTAKSITVKIISGRIPVLRSFDIPLGANVVDLTQNNFTNNNSRFRVSDTTQTIAGEAVGEASGYSVQSAATNAGPVNLTTYHDEKGNEIKSRTVGKSPGVEIDGYKFIRSTTSSSGDVDNIYHKLKTRFVDEKGTEIPGHPEVDGTQDKRDIEGWTYISTTTEDNGDTVHVYHKTAEKEETKTVTRTVKFIDATTGKEIHDPVTQTVTIKRTNVVDSVTGDIITPGTWSTATWPKVDAPQIENYDLALSAPRADEVTVTSDTQDAEVTIPYTQGEENVTERKTVKRTITYVDASDESKQVAKTQEQTVTIERTNVRNKVTGEITTYGDWSTGKFDAVDSPSVENYDAPDMARVDELAVNGDSTDTSVVVKYPQGTEEVPERRIITRTIKYVDASDRSKELAKTVEQRVTLTRTNVRNKVTGAVTEGTWTTGSFEAVPSPEVENYGAPSDATIGAITVTVGTPSSTLTVTYPQGTEEVPEEKTVTRTITYVDASDEKTEVAKSVEQKATISRTNVRNKVTGAVTEGQWSAAQWEAVTSPTVEKYAAPDKASVDAVNITAQTEDSKVVVKYPQGTENVPESKTITRTITYVDEVDGKEIVTHVQQSVTLTRTNVKNLVTGVVTEGQWSTGSFDAVQSPTVENYGKPDTATVPALNVTPDMEDSSVVVKYPQGTVEVPESKVITRTIRYVDETDEKTEVAKAVTQTATVKRTNIRNLVTGEVKEGTWSTAKWDAVKSPAVKNYADPDTASVDAADVTAETADSSVVVKYPQGTEEVPEEKTITRTIRYVDGSGREIADAVVQKVTLKRTNIRNLVTGAVTEGEWSTASVDSQVSPEVAGYVDPSQLEVSAAQITGSSKDETITIVYKQTPAAAQAEQQQKQVQLARTGSNVLALAGAVLLAGLAGFGLKKLRQA